MTSEPIKKAGTPDDEAYLWDRSGPADPLVERLERDLAQFRQHGAAPQLPAEEPVVARIGFGRSRRVALAAGLALVGAAVAWMAWPTPPPDTRPGWAVKVLKGRPVIASKAVRRAARIHEDEWIRTDSAARATLSMPKVGDVTVKPGTDLRVAKIDEKQQRMELKVGSIHARMDVLPQIFFVDTPAGTAVDMGCEYTLDVDGKGNTKLRVLQGWVVLINGLAASVPAGASCRMDMNEAPGCPWFDDAPSALVDALAAFELGAGAIRAILAAARPKDSLTLWHLLSRVSDAERAAVFDRLAEFVPPEDAGVSRDAVLRLDRSALEAWWRNLPDSW